MRARRRKKEKAKVEADQSLNALVAEVETDQSLITTVAETTGRVAAKVTNVIGSLTGVLKRGRKG